MSVIQQKVRIKSLMESFSLHSNQIEFSGTLLLLLKKTKKKKTAWHLNTVLEGETHTYSQTSCQSIKVN